MKIPDLDKEKISYGKYYYFDNNTYTVDASDSEAELEYLCSDFTITKVIYNEDTQNFKYEMFLETPNGEKEVTVDKSVFTSRNLESLTAKGFSFNPDRTKEVLMLALLQEDDAEKITESSYIGFKNNYFWGYARDKDRKCISRVKLEQSKFFDKKQLNRLLNNAPLLQLAYTISASSAVQSFLNNYGHTVREIVSYLEHCPLHDYINAYNEEKQHFLANIPESEKSPLTERLAESFTVLILTAQILAEHKYNINPEVIIGLLLDRNREVSKNYNIGLQVLDAICDRIARNKSHYPDSSPQFGFGDIEGIIYPACEVVLLESTFDKIVQYNGFSSKLVCLRALDKMGCIRRQRSDTYYSKITIDKIPTKVLVVKLNNLVKGNDEHEIHQTNQNKYSC